ncbi:uncharacterized protein LOC122541096 [Chiloscyllium plagiosum]|uniref:uncharacterized protein LOC122541096 n=1 Tax=Chiloscyllium plagiosum TaxID=36176 RepID=UPI001CB85D4A|nr:uncharacterized protein LOC122541096 [Chiloscyllium plagiosum]
MQTRTANNLTKLYSVLSLFQILTLMTALQNLQPPLQDLPGEGSMSAAAASGSAGSLVASHTRNRLKQEAQEKYKWPAANVHVRAANPIVEENRDFNAFAAVLATAWREAFPVRIDMTKIAMSKLREGETVSQYLTHLSEVHNVHSGLRSPEDITAAEIMPYEAHLRNSFINGMKDEIAKKNQVKTALPQPAGGKLHDLEPGN